MHKKGTICKLFQYNIFDTEIYLIDDLVFFFVSIIHIHIISPRPKFNHEKILAYVYISTPSNVSPRALLHRRVMLTNYREPSV